MPHISVKHFPADLSEEAKETLVQAMTQIIQDTFKCNSKVISIASEPIDSEDWMSEVYNKEILPNKDKLIKKPEY